MPTGTDVVEGGAGGLPSGQTGMYIREETHFRNVQQPAVTSLSLSALTRDKVGRQGREDANVGS